MSYSEKVPIGSITGLTTKGDLLTRDASANIRFGVGTDGHFLSADSGETSGLLWKVGGGGSGGDSFLEWAGL